MKNFFNWAVNLHYPMEKLCLTTLIPLGMKSNLLITYPAFHKPKGWTWPQVTISSSDS